MKIIIRNPVVPVDGGVLDAAASAQAAATSAQLAQTAANSATSAATQSHEASVLIAQAKQVAEQKIAEVLQSAVDSRISSTTAITKAAEAGVSANNAATSATNATTKASEAGVSASNAVTSATNATTKASEAGVSASNASTSATTATTKASEASVSASNAATSAQSATTKANEASVSASNAATSATNTTTKANEAGVSASNAATSAQSATTKANEASTSASNAATSATNSTTKANEAGVSASNAATSATNSTTKASEANVSASNAATSAQSATTKANEASVSASNAATSAQNATTKANEAGVSASNAATSAQTATTAKTDSQNLLTQVAIGSPKGSYATLAALNTANPDHLYIYVTIDTGKWNYWGGSAFVVGGQYQAPLSIVQIAGTSVTDVMSQNTTTKLISNTFGYDTTPIINEHIKEIYVLKNGIESAEEFPLFVYATTDYIGYTISNGGNAANIGVGISIVTLGIYTIYIFALKHIGKEVIGNINISVNKNNLSLCPIMKEYLDVKLINSNILLKQEAVNLLDDPHFKFIIPKETQSPVVKDYLFVAGNDYPTYKGGNGALYNIEGAAGNSRIFKIRASKLKELGINSGDYISVAINLKAQANVTETNYINIFGPGYTYAKLVNNNPVLISNNIQVSYSSVIDIVAIIEFGVDNTHGSSCKYLEIDGLTMIKVADANTRLTKTLEAKSFTKQNAGKNIVFDYGFKISSRYTKFLSANTEISILTKRIGTSNYNGIVKNSLIFESTRNEVTYLQQDIIVANPNRTSSFRRGIRLKISIVDASVLPDTVATLYFSRYSSSWNTELPLVSKIVIGDWIDVLSPNYFTDFANDFLFLSFRIELPTGKYKIEIIDPTICGIGDNIYDFQITDNLQMQLPLLGQKWTSVGDSLTDGGTWQLYVSELTGAFPYIRGIGATQMGGDCYPTWINHTTLEGITNILYTNIPPESNLSSLNNIDANSVTFKGYCPTIAYRTQYVPTPSTGQYIWFGAIFPGTRMYWNGSAWIDTGVTPTTENGVTYDTINGRISSADRVNGIPTDSDIITIMAGTNDNLAAGTVDDYAENTFMGYYRRMIDLVSARCPKAKIVLVIFPKFGSEYNSATKTLTSAGILRQSYRDMTRLLAQKYGYNLIDMQSASNFQNMSQFLGADLTHPTADGQKYWAKIFKGQFLM